MLSGLGALLLATAARAQAPLALPQAPMPPPDDSAADDGGLVDAGNDSAGYTPPAPAPAESALHIDGYVDVGFAKAQGMAPAFPGRTSPCRPTTASTRSRPR